MTLALKVFLGVLCSCLGAPLYMQEAKVLLALIARGYDVTNVSGPVDWGARTLPCCASCFLNWPCIAACSAAEHVSMCSAE
jgi:hypothetical protein